MTLIETISTVEAETNSSFSQQIPKLQIAWDSTSLGALKSCPRLYQYSIIEGYGIPLDNPHLKFGIVFHSATELYSRHRARGSDHQTSLLIALRHALVETWDFTLGRPWASKEPTKTRDTLLRSIVWYLDQFQNDPLETLILDNGVPAVELSFRFDTDLETSSGENFQLCGHIDRVVSWNGEIWITDKKTTKAELDDHWFRNFTPDNQVSLYSIAGIVTLNKEIDGLIIDGCQILVTGSRFRRKPISRSREQLEEWMTDLRFWLHQAEGYARANHWPQNEKSCGFGRNQCQFRSVCSAEPAIRQTLLDSQFSRRTWDPLQPR
jgi:PD-(D/E)XK nuclease superfamily